MKLLNLSRIQLTRPRLISFFSLASLMFSLTVFCQIGQAQQAQLSLADILIGLRSKKVTLDERNKLLSGAVTERGITFVLTPEIETELVGGGANRELVEAIRTKAKAVKAPTLDFAYYRQQADENNAKGEYDQAVVDYNKAIELNSKDAVTYLNRGRAYANQKSFDLAMLDYNKTIELNPKEAAAYLNRASIYELRGNAQQAMNDYQKVVELDAANETAKNNLKRLTDEQQAKALAAKPKPQETVAVKETPKVSEQPKVVEAPKVTEVSKTSQAPKPVEASTVPQTVELGQLNNVALKLQMPVYPEIAQKLNAQGKVTVQIALDETGKVVSAKAISGAALLRGTSEDAARKSKFKPTMVGNQAVKATGFITYNFVDKM